MKKIETLSLLFVLIAALIWGTTGTAQAFAPVGTSPLSIAAVRLTIGGTVLVAFAQLRGILGGITLWRKKNTFLAGACVAAYQVLFFTAVLKTGVAVGTVVTLGGAPVFAGMISLLLQRENPGLKWAGATLLSIIGCSFLIMGGQELSANGFGIALALGAGFVYAIYTAANKELLASHAPVAVSGAVSFTGAIFLSPLLFLYDLSWLQAPQGLAVALHLGLIASAFAYALFAYGLANIPFPKAVTLTLAEPVMATGLGIFLLKEKLPVSSQIGIVLVFAGLMLLSLPGLQMKKNASAEDNIDIENTRKIQYGDML